MTCSPQSLRPGAAAFDAGSAAFNQLHNSLNGGSAGHDGIDDAPPPGPVLNPLVDPLVDPVDPEPLLAPKPPVFGPVTTLQKVAVISSMQNTPVIGACVDSVAPSCVGDCA